jgi:hypothetical protein
MCSDNTADKLSKIAFLWYLLQFHWTIHVCNRPQRCQQHWLASKAATSDDTSAFTATAPQTAFLQAWGFISAFTTTAPETAFLQAAQAHLPSCRQGQSAPPGSLLLLLRVVLHSQVGLLLLLGAALPCLQSTSDNINSSKQCQLNLSVMFAVQPPVCKFVCVGASCCLARSRGKRVGCPDCIQCLLAGALCYLCVQ